MLNRKKLIIWKKQKSNQGFKHVSDDQKNEGPFWRALIKLCMVSIEFELQGSSIN